MTDINGNIYPTIGIGSQIWMVENLRTTRYNDGTSIPEVKSSVEWGGLTTPGYCWYNNDSVNYKNTYGALYNWHSIHTGKLAPKGWHIPIYDEWKVLINFLGGEDAACGKLKEQDTTHWHSPNIGATNEYGFTALPGGNRGEDGTFGGIRYMGHWGCNEEWAGGSPFVYSWIIGDKINQLTIDKYLGVSVRCLRDEE
ncbi:MAG: fibrobacter succinogenes major paralogous domain-containing protein [Bacteroidetes bacterium]|nr:fibrobacter succinogenes major paralogous domain-containing protein [Bacteroidota bacterium]